MAISGVMDLHGLEIATPRCAGFAMTAFWCGIATIDCDDAFGIEITTSAFSLIVMTNFSYSHLVMTVFAMRGSR